MIVRWFDLENHGTAALTIRYGIEKETASGPVVSNCSGSRSESNSESVSTVDQRLILPLALA